MEKLKKFQPYQFWALLGLALILPVVGWAMATSSLAKESEERTKAIDGSFSSVQFSGELPNDKWTTGMGTINDVQGKLVISAWQRLWDRQQQFMTWPKDISTSDPMKATPFDLQAYRTRYPVEMRKTWELAQPIVYSEMTDEETGSIEFPRERLPTQDWGALPPSPEQMRDAQEDVWLYRALLKAIAETNRDATGQFDASVREIYEIILKGGGPKPAAGADPMAGGGMGGPGMPEGAGMGMAATQQFGNEKVDFDPAEEFGPEMDGGGGMGMEGGMSGPAMPMPGDPNAPGGGTAGPVIRRYVEDTPQWRTRGFYVKVAVDHRRLPDLLSSLANADWPIRVVRVQQQDLHSEDLAVADTGVAQNRGPGGMSPMAGGAASPMPTFGGGGFGGGGGGFGGAGMGMPEGGAVGMGRVGTVGSGSQSAAMADPMLAVVAISGLITIYKSPAEAAAQDPSQTGQPDSATGQPMASGQPAAPAGTPGQPAAPGGLTDQPATVPGTAPAGGVPPVATSPGAPPAPGQPPAAGPESSDAPATSAPPANPDAPATAVPETSPDAPATATGNDSGSDGS